MATAQAVQFSSYLPDVASVYFTQIPIPSPKPGYAVVQVAASAGNPFDVKKIHGYLKDIFPTTFPCTVGGELSGRITALPEGEDHRGFSVGDDIFLFAFDSQAYSQYTLVPIAYLSKKPASVSFEQSAGLCGVGLTALQALQVFNFQKGQRLLILGGASAVGLIAIQLAKQQGVHVTTTASTRNIAFVSQFGADSIINYEQTKWYEDPSLKGVDAVFDAVGEPKAFANAKSVLKSTGSYATIAGREPELGFDPKGHPPFAYAGPFYMHPSAADQDYLVGLLAAGKLLLPIDQTYPFTQEGVVALLKKVESGKTQGKVIVKIADLQ